MAAEGADAPLSDMDRDTDTRRCSESGEETHSKAVGACVRSPDDACASVGASAAAVAGPSSEVIGVASPLPSLAADSPRRAEYAGAPTASSGGASGAAGSSVEHARPSLSFVETSAVASSSAEHVTPSPSVDSPGNSLEAERAREWALLDGCAESDSSADRIARACERRPVESDLQLCLVSSALRSYKHDSLLRPFPRAFLSDTGEKDYPSLHAAFERLPRSVSGILDAARGGALGALESALLEFALYPRNYRLRRVDAAATHAALQGRSGPSSHPLVPDIVLEVVHPEHSEEPFRRLAAQHGTLCAYHGSLVENFYSILSHGLASHMNKTSLYGEGTYLSSDLTVSYSFSQAQRGWEGTGLGDTVTCLCACDVINHPEIVAAEKGKIRKVSSESDEPIPNKYYLVRNNEHIRVRYLLVFVTGEARVQRRPSLGVRRSPTHAILSWLRRNFFLVALVVYGLMLMYAGGRTTPLFRRISAMFWPPQIRARA